MAAAPLRTARSSEFSSVRDDFSSWLDEIFPPSRLKHGEQVQHPNSSWEQQASSTAQLRRPLPMELPQSSKLAPKLGHVRQEDADEILTRNTTVQGSRQAPPSRKKRYLSLPNSTLPVHNVHHQRHPFGERKPAASTLAPPSRHPATFTGCTYRGGRSSHRPGLRFFEYIPSRVFVSMATTVVFLEPGAAERAGGEVLWLRTNAAGFVQRRIFSSAGCLLSSPKLRRRVALSLCGRDKDDGAMGTVRASASAPSALRRLRRGARGTGAVPTGASETKGFQHPTALLKVYRSCSRQSGSRNNNNDGNDDNGSKPERAREKEGGGNTDVLCLDTLTEVEEILLKAGEGAERLSDKQPDTVTAQEPNVRLTCGKDGALGTNIFHYGPYQRTEKESDIAPEAGTPKANEVEEMLSIGDYYVPPPCSKLPTEAALPSPRNALLGGRKAEVVPRARPWAIQKYLRPKGPLAWGVRVVWRRNRDSFCWILSDSNPLISSDVSRGGGMPGGASWCNAVRSIAGQAGWEAPKAFVADMVAALEAAESAPASNIPLRFGLMAVDLIADRDGKWWLTQVKAFRLLRPTGKPTPATPAPLSVSETSRASSAETSGGCGDGVEGYGNHGVRKYDSTASQFPRRSCGAEIPEQGGDELLQEPLCVAVKEAEMPPHAPSAPVAFSSALTKPAVVAAAAEVSRKTPTKEQPFSTAELRRKSSCPGLYCGSGGQGREEQKQPAKSTRTLLVPDSTRNRNRCINEETSAGEEVARGRIALSGPKQEITTAVVGNSGGPGAGEAYPMFRLPLKALVIYDGIVRFRRALITRQRGAAGAAEGGGRGNGWDAIHARRIRLAQNVAIAPFLDEPALTGGSHGVSLQSASIVESRAIAALRKRDRVRLYDDVPLCAECYREYSENWRWWLARGTEPKNVNGVPPQAREAVGPTHSRPKPERAGGRRGREKQNFPGKTATVTIALTSANRHSISSPYTHGRPSGRVSTLLSKAPVSSSVSPEGSAPDNYSDVLNGIDDANNTSGSLESTITASHPEKNLSKTEQLDQEASSAGSTALQHHQPGQRESDVPRNGARYAETSTLDTFKARLDSRLEGISIPRASQTTDKCTRGGVKNAAPRAGEADRQQEEPQSGDSTANEVTAVENELLEVSESAPMAAHAGTRTTGDPCVGDSRSVTVARVPVAEGGPPVAPADAEPVAEKGVAQGSTSSQRSNGLAQEPAEYHRRKRTSTWEKCRVDWNLKNA